MSGDVQSERSDGPGAHPADPTAARSGAAPSGSPSSSLPDLPPVEPPSAGFIVQLFVVPALIVSLVVGVWALFGRLAAGEQDWRGLVQEMQSENPLRRDRAAHGLAQLLASDQRLGEHGQHLSRDPEIARALAKLFETQLKKSGGATEAERTHQAFLAGALGYLDRPELTVPLLREAMEPGRDRDVRTSAMRSVAVLAQRTADEDRAARKLGSESGSDAHAVERLVETEALVDDVIRHTRDEDRTVRHLATYTLGLLPCDESRRRLEMLLADGDADVRVNAAIGLVRQHSTAGLDVFADVLEAAATSEPDPALKRPGSPEDLKRARDKEFEEFVTVKNVLKAVAELAGELRPEDRARFAALATPLSDHYRQEEIRVDAGRALQKLGAK